MNVKEKQEGLERLKKQVTNQPDANNIYWLLKDYADRLYKLFQGAIGAYISQFSVSEGSQFANGEKYYKEFIIYGTNKDNRHIALFRVISYDENFTEGLFHNNFIDMDVKPKHQEKFTSKDDLDEIILKHLTTNKAWISLFKSILA